jgi:4-hydroxy-2-oxoheptanedioate aldolase
MHMKESNVLKKLRDGKIVISVKTNLAEPRIVEIAAMCGYDCMWLDMEHIPNDWQVIENQIRAAKMHNLDTVVRVSRGSYGDLIKPLEADASGIMVPHVMGTDDAKNIINQTRFQPIGRRPVDGGNADGAFTMIDFNEYLQSSNEQKFIIFQIEDPEPLQELDQIAKLDGFDMLFFGPGDFSHGIGAPGQWDHPDLLKARERIVKTARENKKFAGTVGSLDNLGELIDMGFQFINVGVDILGLIDYFKNITTTGKQIISDATIKQ